MSDDTEDSRERMLLQEDDMLQPPTPAKPETGADWTEDLPHENGNYQGRCIHCGRMFQGHKRRVVCKVCSSANPETCALCDNTRECHGVHNHHFVERAKPEASCAVCGKPISLRQAHGGQTARVETGTVSDGASSVVPGVGSTGQPKPETPEDRAREIAERWLAGGLLHASVGMLAEEIRSYGDEQREVEQDQLGGIIRAMAEELCVAGFPMGDRFVTLSSFRAALAALAESEARRNETIAMCSQLRKELAAEKERAEKAEAEREDALSYAAEVSQGVTHYSACLGIADKTEQPCLRCRLEAAEARAEKERERADDHDSARQSEKERADYAYSEAARLRAERDDALSHAAESIRAYSDDEVTWLREEVGKLHRLLQRVKAIIEAAGEEWKSDAAE